MKHKYCSISYEKNCKRLMKVVIRFKLVALVSIKKKIQYSFHLIRLEASRYHGNSIDRR